MNPLRRAAMLALCAHLIAGAAMLLVLRHGLETNPDLSDRLAFLANHRIEWTLAWLTWTAAAIAILYFYLSFATNNRLSLFAVWLTFAAIAPDLSAQAIEIGVLPSLAIQASSENFLLLHRIAIMLSGYLANGLYSVAAALLVWQARRLYPAWVSVVGLAVGVSGIALSVAALLDSPDGMFWTNVLLVPSLLIWFGAVGALARPK